MHARRAAELGERNRDVDKFVVEALFSTVTNVDFDPERLEGLIRHGLTLRKEAKALYEAACAKSGRQGHPIDTFQRENEALREVVAELRKRTTELASREASSPADADLLALREVVNQLADIDKHYQRKENLLFSCLERHGVSGPSKVMWGKDDEVRRLLKQLAEALKDAEGTYEQLRRLFAALPVDLTFVDAEDRVRYFSEGPDRVFARSKAIIGRKVQHCHPPKSAHIVEQILEDFRSGRQSLAEFWIEFQGKFIYIRYFAVRDEGGKYAGTLEVTQDLTHIRTLQGERRLLQYGE